SCPPPSVYHSSLSYRPGRPRDLHSFPTRRSSDLCVPSGSTRLALSAQARAHSVHAWAQAKRSSRNRNNSCCENVVVTQRGLPGPVRSNPAGAGHGSVFVRDGRGYPRPMVNTAWMETTDLAAGRGAVGIGLAVGV